MKRLFVALLALSFAPPIAAQTMLPAPPSLTIAITPQTNGTTNFRFSWQTVPGYTAYDLLTFSRPRIFDLEQLRVVTGTSWTINVPNSQITDSMFIYGSVRVSLATPRYASTIYRIPPIARITALDVKPDSVSLAPGATQQFCAFVVFDDGKMAMRNPEKGISSCVALYDSLPAGTKPPTIAQQLVADTVQVQWTVIDGIPTASTVNVASPVREVWILRP